ncbi:TRAP transporter substrate-binding protein [Pusillimonas sp. ANT_WB101]|uniref:TRAP transporter substrate-binding protein n=1 Tax=Pusillimonas sp. ANT_WB101 TaxID=2597356 RepID=UPI0011EE6100|nr:TRAP transporter substrate-binding protein [Pusillimonas sp. ANT_WB101]KAA0892529.1 TRAP transporter substrate-binding protein [Pusillimonas sp. ANT_WB101]
MKKLRPSVFWFARKVVMISLALSSASAMAQMELNISVPWGKNEVHSVNAERYAKRVLEETGGYMVLKPHPGGTLGVKASESMRAIGEGVVPMGDFALFQNASRGAVLAAETLPFMVHDFDELKVLHRSFRPLWEKVLAKNNQKALYMAPWPSQFFFLKQPVNSIDDLKGVKMRTLDKLTSDWITRLGMLPVQMTNLEILQALGAGMIEGIPTSAGTAVAQKYWDFLDYGYVTNHIWASNAMAINLDVWKKIPPEHQATMERIAKEMEPEFWEAAKQDHEQKMAELKKNGMKIAVAPEALLREMQERTAPLWAVYVKPMGADAVAALAQYRQATGK